MKDKTVQAGNSTRPSRCLKVEAVGDFANGRIIPRIRLAGRWLEQAGFKPGDRVQIQMDQPGSLRIDLSANDAD